MILRNKFFRSLIIFQRRSLNCVNFDSFNKSIRVSDAIIDLILDIIGVGKIFLFLQIKFIILLIRIHHNMRQDNKLICFIIFRVSFIRQIFILAVIDLRHIIIIY